MLLSTAEVMYWLTMFASVLAGAAAVLDARRKEYDLFGVMIIAFCAALGGGTLRDTLLDRPVFWVVDSSYLLVTWAGALATFFLARRVHLSGHWFVIPDAAALGLYTIAGTQAALAFGADWLIASFMGVITGVAGGILRDILLNQDPLVFQGQWYATAAWTGSLLYILIMQQQWLPLGTAVLLAGTLIFLLRMAALRWNLSLPRYREK